MSPITQTEHEQVGLAQHKIFSQSQFCQMRKRIWGHSSENVRCTLGPFYMNIVPPWWIDKISIFRGQQLNSYQGEVEKTREWMRTVFCLAWLVNDAHLKVYLYILYFVISRLVFIPQTMVIFIGGVLLCWLYHGYDHRGRRLESRSWSASCPAKCS
jgi:hypothetical protein